MRSFRDGSTTVAEAFAPGHVTGIFAPRLDARDPRGRGSVGAGLVLELGVRATARWDRGGADRVTVRTTPSIRLPISLDAALRTKGERRGSLSVTLTHQLPVGQGFGMSAAGALATARAASEAIGPSRRSPREIAHLADLFGGGGLGGVAAIGGGGLEIRQRPGIPPWGSIRRIRFPRPVILAAVGRPLPSPPLLGNRRFLERVEAAADEGLSALRSEPTAATFLSASEGFTDQVRLGPASLTRRIRTLRRTGAAVAQAMFGRALFAVPPDGPSRERLLRALARDQLSAVEVRVLPPSAETL